MSQHRKSNGNHGKHCYCAGWYIVFQGVCSGVLVGCGKQHLGAIVNLVGYYFLALPLAILLSVSGWDLSGM